MESLFTRLYVAISLKGQTGLPSSTGDIGQAVTKVVKLLITLIGSLALIFIVVGGLLIVTSAGSPRRIEQGRETIIYAVVGLIVAIGALAVVTFISKIGQ